MIVVEPKDRITVDEIIDHPWCYAVKKGGPINGLVHEVGQTGVRLSYFLISRPIFLISSGYTASTRQSSLPSYLISASQGGPLKLSMWVVERVGGLTMMGRRTLYN